jgi:hypothetical protein
MRNLNVQNEILWVVKCCMRADKTVSQRMTQELQLYSIHHKIGN